MHTKKANFINFSAILILSPHTDDAEISAGGTITKLSEKCKEIHYTAFSWRAKDLEDPEILKNECSRATQILGISNKNLLFEDYEVRNFLSNRQSILEDLIMLKKGIQPDLVLVPSSFDVHQDHRVIYEEALRAFKPSASIFGYEHPWNNYMFSTDVFVRLQKRDIQKKIEALIQYKSQHSRPYFNKDYIKSLAITRGVQCNSQFAEAFELLRLVM